MHSQEKISYLVVDTTGFIKNAPFQEMAENVLTTPAVVKELTSKSQLRRLAVLPYDLKVKEPFPEHIKFVTEFAKKTGDYISLSATDIQVMALTYQLALEEEGGNNLRTEPVKTVINPSGSLGHEFKEVAGFYIPKNLEESNNVEEISKQIAQVSIEEQTSEGQGEESEEWFDASNHHSDEHSNSEDEDDSGWITPGNIKEMKQKITSAVEEQITPIVGCLTTDFAMQNVLKQIGLHVIALDGRVIREIRTFILRCYACYKTTSVMTKIFCPNCGNKTLKKVAVTTNPDGMQQIHINFRRPLTARGKRFSLPTPKGGKHANNPILSEDQPMPQQRASKLSRAKTNALEDDYIAGFSPFVTKDVTSRSAMLGIRPNAQIKQWMRRNPNECTKPGGRKRK